MYRNTHTCTCTCTHANVCVRVAFFAVERTFVPLMESTLSSAQCLRSMPKTVWKPSVRQTFRVLLPPSLERCSADCAMLTVSSICDTHQRKLREVVGRICI